MSDLIHLVHLICWLVCLFVGIRHSVYNSCTVLLLSNLIVVTVFIAVMENKGSFKNKTKPHPFVFIRWNNFLDMAYVMGWVRIYLHCELIYMTRTVEY